MASPDNFEGKDEEVVKYVRDHPGVRFRLEPVTLLDVETAGEQTRLMRLEALKELDEFAHAWKGKLPVLPLEATSTEALYD